MAMACSDGPFQGPDFGVGCVVNEVWMLVLDAIFLKYRSNALPGVQRRWHSWSQPVPHAARQQLYSDGVHYGATGRQYHIPLHRE